MGMGTVSAQATHYLFFQTENNKPFYLRIMGSTLSSNASGYLLIPKITDGNYPIHIGFAQSNTEQEFELKVEGKDLGFSLKQELDNSWTLFNLIDFSQHKGKTVAIIPKEEVKPVEEPVVEQKVKEAEKQTEKKETGSAIADSAAKSVPATKEITKSQRVLPQILKIYDKTSADGIDMVFVVNGVPRNDTVIIYVPAIKPPGMAGRSWKSSSIKGVQAGITSIQPFIFHPTKNP